jgi:hypothetical protein
MLKLCHGGGHRYCTLRLWQYGSASEQLESARNPHCLGECRLQGDPRAHSTWLASRPRRFEKNAIRALIDLLKKGEWPVKVRWARRKARLGQACPANALWLGRLATQGAWPTSTRSKPTSLRSFECLAQLADLLGILQPVPVPVTPIPPPASRTPCRCHPRSRGLPAAYRAPV